ncbi:hypothetical protein [Sphingomonas sp. PAMC 26605]|uniref:hypothetical protein n=1 Tax=Sphingomonas sp. PAMC 26605 TaxID=1112214 RepID=UPI0012F5242B|nr:hypothetical protein [Sphingomonas sp. PAMC 26605]
MPGIIRDIRIGNENVAVDPAPVSGEPDFAVDGIYGIQFQAPPACLRPTRLIKAQPLFRSASTGFWGLREPLATPEDNGSLPPYSNIRDQQCIGFTYHSNAEISPFRA